MKSTTDRYAWLLPVLVWLATAAYAVVPQELQDMDKKKQEIADFIERRNKAMIERDTGTLDRLMADDLILTHITGATQTKQEWLKEIAKETMRYYRIKTEDLAIEINGNVATAHYISVIEARIWGIRGTWRLHSVMHLQKTAEGWLWSNEEKTSNITNR